MSTSLQNILKSRQEEEFVGREEQLAFFRRNLGLAPENPSRRFIVNISGQGGVGKTWLLRRFRQIAEDSGAVTACTDETESDIPAVMSCIAEQFGAQGHNLKSFAERYKVYRQRKKEIAADPETPQGFPGLVGRTLAKSSLDALQGLGPVAGVVAGAVDKEAFAELGGEFAGYVARKVKNKDEVHLVLEPVEVLTPLFLADLQKVAEEHAVALFFDTYERTGEFLDPWLRDLLEGRHGDVPPDIVLTITGRDGLDRNHWSPYEGALARFPLNPFTDKETRNYLTRKGITEESVIDVILNISGRLPLLVATLAAERPSDPVEVGDPSGEAVERFLSWVDEPERRQVALNAALPCRLNRDVLAVLTGEERAQSLFVWLKGMPFVEKRGDAWVYHEVVRNQLLRYKRQESPRGWADLHELLARHYEELQDGLESEAEIGRKDDTGQRYALEVLYHRLCHAQQKELAAGLNGFLAALKAEDSFARRWAKVIEQAGKDNRNTRVQDWGEKLVSGMKAREANRYEESAEVYTELLGYSELEKAWQAEALARRGTNYILTGQYKEALVDFNRAINLAPEDARVITGRGITRMLMKCYDEALTDFERAVDLNPQDADIIAIRGVTYMHMEHYERALADFDQAIALNPEDASIIANRSVIYMHMERYEDALTDIDRSIDLEPDNLLWQTVRLGVLMKKEDMAQVYTTCAVLAEQSSELVQQLWDVLTKTPSGVVQRQMDWWASSGSLDPDVTQATMKEFLNLVENDREASAHVLEAVAMAKKGFINYQRRQFEKALAAYSKALELDASQPIYWTARGQIYLLMEKCQDALADFDRAIELDPEDAQSMANRAVTYQKIGRYEKALADFDRAIELDPEDAQSMANRAVTYQKIGRYEKALADFDRAIELDENMRSELANERGLVFSYLGRYADAVECYEQTLRKGPDYVALYNVAVATTRWKGLDNAGKQVDIARERLRLLLETDKRSTALYGLGGLEALEGNTDQALKYLQEALLIEEQAAGWARHDVAWLDLRENPRFQALIQTREAEQ
jgi:tetratricopeptide (TPR) repeat protein